MKKKVLLIAVLFLVLFLGEIAISFSFTEEKNRNIANSEVVPLSHKLNAIDIDSSTIAIENIVDQFMTHYNIKGASVAIAKEGRLVYTKSFGYANKKQDLAATPENVYRIASVSKLITAVAIMKLIEEEKLSLDTKILGPNGVLNSEGFSNYTDKRYEKITIKHLLEHTAGWNSKKGDPIFNSLYVARRMKVTPPAKLNTVIEYALQNKLDWSPGKKYSYSNLGYCILGKVIEVISGMSYEAYVQFAILHPLGIYDMHIGNSYMEQRRDNEVVYYSNENLPKIWSFDGSRKLVPVQYGGNNMQLLGAAGGWVASAPELAKFMVAVDGFTSRPDYLTKESIKFMTYSGKKRSKLIGWRGTDGHGTWWRTGTLTGSTALIMRHKNETNWVILLNTSTKQKSRIHNELSHTMFKAIRSVKSWPEYDLFEFEPNVYEASSTIDNIQSLP